MSQASDKKELFQAEPQLEAPGPVAIAPDPKEQIELLRLQYEADALRISNESSEFRLVREKIYLAIGLVLLVFLIIGAIGLYLLGQKPEAVYLLASGSGVGGVGIILKQALPGA
jgi:hypothetical protein